MTTAIRDPRHIAMDSAPERAVDGARRDRRLGPVTALVATTMLVIGAFVVGDRILAAGIRLQQGAPPLTGAPDWHAGPRALPALLVGFGAGAVLLETARRASWRAVVALSGLVALAWSVALAWIDGPGALTTPLLSGQYIRTVPRVGDLHAFLSHFVTDLGAYNVHTRGHPPGMVVVLWTLDRIGLGGTGPNVGLVLVGGALGAVAALVTAREVAGERFARRAAPFVALTPAAIWWSSGDAFFAAVVLAAVAATVLATGRTGSRSDAWAVLGGALFTAAAYLSYGLVVLAVVPVVVAGARRRWQPIVVAGSTALAIVTIVTAVTGFAWWDGLAATRREYFAGVASRRPYEYYVFANLAVFALMIGPAAVAALGRLRRAGAVALLVGAALGAVALADLSGLSKAEVERIWIPFVPLVAAGAGLVAPARRSAHAWVAAQVTVTILLAVGIRSPW